MRRELEKIAQRQVSSSDGKELPDEMKTVASPLSVHPPPNHQSVPSSKRRIRKKEKILKFHIKNLWQSFRNTQNVRSKLQQQQRDFTDVFHKEKKKISFQHQLQEAESSLFPKAAVAAPKSPRLKSLRRIQQPSRSSGWSVPPPPLVPQPKPCDAASLHSGRGLPLQQRCFSVRLQGNQLLQHRRRGKATRASESGISPAN